MMRWWLPVGLSFSLVACSAGSSTGSLVGSFLVQASLQNGACQLEEAPDGGTTFSVTISRDDTSDRATIQLGGFNRPGQLRGQQVRSVEKARRVFTACGGCETALVETLVLELYSVSQAEAVGRVCPAGLPAAPVSETAIPIQFGTLSSDALLACGSLEVAIQNDADGGERCAACQTCRFSYTLEGVRQ